MKRKVTKWMNGRIGRIGFVLWATCVLSAGSAFASGQERNKGVAEILRRSEGSITFVVDENLPAPKKKLTITPNEMIARWIVGKEQIRQELQNVVKISFEQERMDYMGQDNLFRSMVLAYADHRPLVLSPDMVWLIICQGFAGYVNQHPEQLRNQLVNHEGKMTIAVQSDTNSLLPDADWGKLLDAFSTGISKNVKGDIAKTVTADFTTTGLTELVASQITLLETVKSYFTYLEFYAACGIPSVTLQGTPADWKKVLKKTRSLSQYGLEPWVSDLEEILVEFVKASEGKPNQRFWQNMVRKLRVDELRGGACSSEKATELDGWCLKFFPDKEGRTFDKVDWNKSMPSEMVRVGFDLVLFDPDIDSVHVDVPMELWAGFVGVAEDSITGALTPKIGWLARVADEEKESLARLEYKDRSGGGLYFLVRPGMELPHIISKLPHVRRLRLDFEGAVEVPDWVDDMNIEEFIIEGKFSESEKVQLRQRFPNVVLKDWDGD